MLTTVAHQRSLKASGNIIYEYYVYTFSNSYVPIMELITGIL